MYSHRISFGLSIKFVDLQVRLFAVCAYDCYCILFYFQVLLAFNENKLNSCVYAREACVIFAKFYFFKPKTHIFRTN